MNARHPLLVIVLQSILQVTKSVTDVGFDPQLHLTSTAWDKTYSKGMCINWQLYSESETNSIEVNWYHKTNHKSGQGATALVVILT